ncbi:MAG: GMP synthase-like glutamine amidotransferase [Gammaproteobacteria bacterium]|jgi:GMP synthase-like glutamine amidotransferase
MYRLGLIACDVVPDELRDRFDDYPTMFEKAIASTSAKVQWQVYRAYREELPNSANECDGYIMTGSRNSAFDTEQWIRSLEQFIVGLVDGGQPLVGICFGHQVIAQALGGKVEKSDHGWGIGLRRYRTAEYPMHDWMHPPAEEFTVPVCHQDQVSELPQQAQLLASSKHCENFMVQFNESMLGFQGHPEFNKDYIHTLLDLRELTITGATRETALASLQRTGDNPTIMQWIVNFLGIH